MSPPSVVPPDADHVIGIFPRETLSAALASTHRAGFGPQTRVIDASRGGIDEQLDRLGLSVQWIEPPGHEEAIILVVAPGRRASVTDMFWRLGARAVVCAARRGAASAAPNRVALSGPDIRIGADAAADAGSGV